MSNIWRLFCDDVKHLTSNVVTAVIVLGLVFMPSIFSWYNILASWNVFQNTGNLTVAVANTDEGYQSDLVPLRVNIGEQVVSSLRANDQLNWKFTSEADAIDGTASGKYYAAVVIPTSFSKDMMTFYSEDVEHAQITYYTNEKKSAVAPKVTDQGADQVSYQINEIFTKTLSEAALSISAALFDYADSADTNSRIGDLAKHVDTMSVQMSQTASVLRTYAAVMGASQSLVDGSSDLLAQAQVSADDVEAEADQGQQAVSSITDAMNASSDALSKALQESNASYAGLSNAIDQAFSTTGTLTGDSAKQLRDSANAVDAQVVQYQALVKQLQALEPQMDAQYQPAVETAIARLNASIELQKSLSANLRSAADQIDAGNTDTQAQYAQVKQLVAQAQQSVSGLASSYDTDIRPGLDQLTSEVATVVSTLQASADTLDAVGSDLQGSTGSISAQLGDAKQKLTAAADDMDSSAQQLTTLSQAISQALAVGDSEALRALLGSDPTTLAAALAAPVQLDRIAVFPADNFGSQMAPLYTTLAIWIGSLLLVVAIKVVVSRKAQDNLDDPKLYQMFLGRFGVFAVLSLCQTTTMALGNMLFLGVQVSDPLLFMVCFWVAGLVFTFVIYALVVAFANLGKAIAVFLLIIQVTSGGGSFPLPLLPHFLQVLSPYLPATHVINAMRAAMMGVYQNDFWIEIGLLLLFLIPAALLGLVLRKPLMAFLNWYVGKVEDSKLVS